MAKPKNVQLEEKLVAVPAEFAGRYKWLGKMKSNLKTAAEKRERELRAKGPVAEVDKLARRYHRLSAAEEHIKAELDSIKEQLRNLWAQQGLLKAEGITIFPSFELQLLYNQVLAELTPDIAAQVIRHEPMFKVDAFLQLVETGKVPQDVVDRYLRGKFEVQVKRVSSAAAN